MSRAETVKEFEAFSTNLKEATIDVDLYQECRLLQANKFTD